MEPDALSWKKCRFSFIIRNLQKNACSILLFISIPLYFPHIHYQRIVDTFQQQQQQQPNGWCVLNYKFLFFKCKRITTHLLDSSQCKPSKTESFWSMRSNKSDDYQRENKKRKAINIFRCNKMRDASHLRMMKSVD